ncbi:hypothetical protein D3C80_1261120 [compost metagenome]
MLGGLGQCVGVVTGDRTFYRISGPLLSLAEKPALLTGRAFVRQAVVSDEFGGMLWRAMPFEVRGARRHLKAMRGQNPRLHA